MMPPRSPPPGRHCSPSLSRRYDWALGRSLHFGRCGQDWTPPAPQYHLYINRNITNRYSHRNRSDSGLGYEVAWGKSTDGSIHDTFYYRVCLLSKMCTVFLNLVAISPNIRGLLQRNQKHCVRFRKEAITIIKGIVYFP